VAQAGCDDRSHQGANAIGSRIGSGGLDGDGVYVAAGDGAMQQLCGGDAQHARARADIEHMSRAPAFQRAIQRQQAAQGRAVMARAEGQRRLYLDAHVVFAQPKTIMRAMHQHAAGAHGLEPRQRAGHPIPLGDL
jgi:hypothetical protein